MRDLDRRSFLRAASLAALGAAAACSGAARPTVSTTGSVSPTPTGSSPTPTGTPARALAWQQRAVSGPSARRDHSLTANDSGTIAFLFGGRAGGKPLADLWAFERASNTWERLDAKGPSARFGHSAAYLDGHLVVFGGQGGPGAFSNDAWAFDPVRGTWTKLAPAGAVPAARYGAGGTTIGSALAISHGFTDRGRFDDTWALATRWTDVSPKEGPRPGKRCLHRTVYLPGLGRMVLFGGQTDGTPFLGDTWLYDPTTQRWEERKVPGPAHRNLYAAAGTRDTLWLFGGAGAAGPLDDVWTFGNKAWKRQSPAGTPPPKRSGVEGAVVAGPSLLVFGGAGAAGELADTWELVLPA